MIKKEECTAILNNLKEEIAMWEWEEDYYGSGYRNKGERIAWTLDRMDAVIKIVKDSDLP